MLCDFIAENREEILANARRRVLTRSPLLGVDREQTHDLRVFLDQLGEALRKSKLPEAADHTDIKDSAGHHGNHLFHQGLTVAVHGPIPSSDPHRGRLRPRRDGVTHQSDDLAASMAEVGLLQPISATPSDGGWRRVIA